MAKDHRLLETILILLLALFMLAACSSPAGEVSESEPEAAPAEEEAPAEEPEAPAEEVTGEEETAAIDLWIPAGRGRDEAVAAVVDAFEAENPNIEVEVNAIPFAEFLSSLQVAYAGDNPPDVAFLDGVSVQNLAYNGALLPISDLITDEDRQDYMSDLIDMVNLDGEAYALPFAQSAVAMYYNVDMFADAGIEVPQTLDEAWTWPEFKENIEAVASNQGEGTWGVVGLQAPIQGAFFTWTMVRSNSEPGSPLWDSISPDYTTVDGYVNTPEAMEAYAFYQSLYTDGLAPRDDVPDAFGNGLAATYLAIPPIANGLTANFPDLDWDVMPVPYFKTPLTHTGSFTPAVAAKSDNPDEAKLLANFFASPEGYLTYHSVTPMIPARVSMQNEIPELQEGYLAFLFEEAMQWGQARPGGPAHSILNLVIAEKMMVDIALGGDIEETVANAVAEADAQLMQFR